MLLSAVFPLCDLRDVRPDAGATPALRPRLAPGAFVPWFGAVTPAGRNPRRGAPGEGLVVAAPNALQIHTWPLGPLPGPFRCLFRDLTRHDDVVSRYDLTLGTRFETAARLPGAAALLRGFVDLEVTIPQQPRRGPLPLAQAGAPLTRAYAESTTRIPDRRHLGPDLVLAADPAFFVVWSEAEALSEKGAPPLSPVPGSPHLLAGRAPLTEAGPTACVWYLKQLGGRLTDADDLRAALADLWTQRACLRAALRQIEDGRLAPPPNPRARRPPESASPPAPPSLSDRLQAYLNEAVTRIDRRGRNLPVSTAPLRFTGPGGETRDAAEAPDLQRLRAALGALQTRGNITRKVTDWAHRDATTGDPVPLPHADTSPTRFTGSGRPKVDPTAGDDRLRGPGSLPDSAPPNVDPTAGDGPDEGDGPSPFLEVFLSPRATPPKPEAFQGTLHTSLSARGRELVAPGDRVAFDLHLLQGAALPDPGPAGKTGSLPFTLAAGVSERRLHLSASSRDFVPLARETWTTTVVLRRDGPRPGLWSFEALALPDRPSYTFSVTFVLDDQPAGTLTVTLPRRDSPLVAPTSPRAEATLPLGDRPPSPVDLQIDIAYEGNVPVVKWRVAPGDPIRPWEIRFDTTEHWNALGEPQYQPYKELLGYSRRLGSEMDQDLFDALSKARGGTVLVVSPLPLFPFELVPLGRKAPFLGAECSFARWISRPDLRPLDTSALVVKRAACIRPEYKTRPLPSAAEEASKLAERFPGLLDLRTRAQIEALLDGEGDYEGVNLVHFAGHAEDNPPKLLLAEGGPLLPSELWKTPLADRRPFLFVNGCRAGMAHAGLPPSLGNMIESLLATRTGGVVAPFITVDSRAAARAADTFYEAALAGKTIAESVREIHKLADQDPDHAATYLSYLSYVPPGLRLVREKPQT